MEGGRTAGHQHAAGAAVGAAAFYYESLFQARTQRCTIPRHTQTGMAWVSQCPSVTVQSVHALALTFRRALYSF